MLICIIKSTRIVRMTHRVGRKLHPGIERKRGEEISVYSRTAVAFSSRHAALLMGMGRQQAEE
jgi:hypothetical protein